MCNLWSICYGNFKISNGVKGVCRPLKQSNWGETFYVSFSVGDVSYGLLLMQKVQSHMKPISFDSKVKSHSEMGYSEVEQWAFALVLACRKFRYYLLPKKFVVVTSSTMLPDVILHLKPRKRIMRWVLELQEFEYEFLIDHIV